jgi:N-acetyl-gamma-glutamyl-phosphate reductase
VSVRVHVAGASGYAAGELIRLLDRHPDVELATLESHSAAGKRVCDIFPYLPAIEMRVQNEGAIAASLSPGDVVFLAGHRELARERAPGLLASGARVVDLSDAFRLSENANGAVYGFPERYAAQIARASLVANPGCYPTATMLALLPLAPFAESIVNVVVDAKSGITGAGRTPSVSTLFAEVEGDVRAYGMGGHRHHPEIEQEARAISIDAPVLFSPHVVPLGRGMLADVYCVLREPLDANVIAATFERTYAGSPFVHVFTDGRVPNLPSLEKTNDAQLAFRVTNNVIHVLCGIDNLGKGAAGEAVQNLNIMCGFPEDRALGTAQSAIV